MSLAEIEGTATVMIMAGSETTASFLCGATFYVLANPWIHERLRDEIRGSFDKEESITMSSTRVLYFLNLVIKEVLRIYPPTPSTLPRRTGADGGVIDGAFVPANVSGFFNDITLACGAVHRIGILEVTEILPGFRWSASLERLAFVQQLC